MNTYTLEDLSVGMTERFSVTVTDQMMTAFLQITGDNNPMHCDEDYARSQGFDGRVVYGMLSSAFYSTLAGVYLPGKYCLLQSVDCKMRAPVYIGDVLTVEGTVSQVYPEMNMIRVKAVITNQHGKKVSKAVLQMGILAPQ